MSQRFERRPLRTLGAFAIASSLLVAPCTHAQGPQRDAAATAERDEAHRRFDRGLSLYETGDYWGALAEFQRAYQLSAHPAVLYNVMLVEARLGHAAEAVAAFERLKPDLAGLGRERAERAQTNYEEQLKRVGTLEFAPSLAEAVIQVDQVELPKDVRAVRVTAGAHVVSLWAEGYAPRNISVHVAAEARVTVPIEMLPLATPLARLRVTSPLADVEVREGGELLARTPLASELVLPAGLHRLTFSRPGYAPETRELTLAARTREDLKIRLRRQPLAANEGSLLTLSVSEDRAQIVVDGEARPDATSGIRLSPGRHGVHVARTGFFDVSREVVLAPGPTRLEVTLLPTAAFLSDYVSRARTQRTLAFVSAGAGLAFVAAGTGFLLWNSGEKADAEAKFDTYAKRAEAMPQGTCDPACQQELAVLIDDVDQKSSRDVYGWLAVGVGGAALTTGALLYFLGPDPNRYLPTVEPRPLARTRVEIGPRAARLSLTF